MTPRLDPAPPGWAGAVTLEGELVRLEPLAPGHLGELAAVAFEPAIWRWMPIVPRTVDDLHTWLETALRTAAGGTEVPFATLDRRTGRVIGSTRYLAIVPEHRRLEIGWTWLGVEHQRTGANREAKRLLLAHAFETLGANRVEFKTDANNERSRAALLGIGRAAPLRLVQRDGGGLARGQGTPGALPGPIGAGGPGQRSAIIGAPGIITIRRPTCSISSSGS
jgi:RimJ/RimL family protein N-acetyltransferase